MTTGHYTQALTRATNYFLTLFKATPHYLIISQRYSISNHPIWLIGHLTHHYHRANCIINNDKPSIRNTLLPQWAEKFNTGTRPLPLATLYPKEKELIQHYTNQRDILLESIDLLTPGQLTKAHPVLPKHDTLASYVLGQITHTSYHTGQLTQYRAVHELPSINQDQPIEKAIKESLGKAQHKIDTLQETPTKATGHYHGGHETQENAHEPQETSEPQGTQEQGPGTPEKPTYPCPKCNRTFTKRFALTNHLKAHK